MVDAEWIGWASTGILIITVGRQAFTQWKETSTAGLSRWFYVGQLATSAGYVTYSVLLNNIVFVISNVFLLMIAIVGQILFIRNRRLEKNKGDRR